MLRSVDEEERAIKGAVGMTSVPGGTAVAEPVSDAAAEEVAAAQEEVEDAICEAAAPLHDRVLGSGRCVETILGIR